SDAYPTDSSFRFQMAARMFALGHYNDAIPVLQNVRSDPKYKGEAGVYLGRSFLMSGFIDEAVETLKTVIDEYPHKGDSKSKDMYYYYGRALEEHKDSAAAIKAYSQLAQWDFNFKDVQARIKKLRSTPQPPPQ